MIRSSKPSRWMMVGMSGITALALSASLIGCLTEEPTETTDANQQAAEKTAYPITMTAYDGNGNEFTQTFDKAPERVIALNDSSAEIMCMLGLGDKVIGAVEPEAPMPAEIADAYARIPQLGDKKTLSKEIIIGSEPDLIIGRAKSFTAEELTDADSYNSMGIDIYSQLSSTDKGDPSLQGVIADIQNIAKIFNAEDAAEPIVADLTKQLDGINGKVANQTGEKPSVLLIGNLTEGTYGIFGGDKSAIHVNLVEDLGGHLVTTKGAKGLTYENLIESNPDVLIYITSERNKEADATALETLYSEPMIQDVPAIADKRVVTVPYAEFLDSTPRIFDTAEKLLLAFYPDAK